MEPKVDLEWDDGHVAPDEVYPDLVFVVQRMNTVTTEQLKAGNGESILDVGCGRAVDVTRLAQEGGRCIGLEPSRKMLDHAKEHIARSKAEVALVQGMVDYLPFKTSSLDRVICKGALDHFPYPDRAIEEMGRVLKPRGKAMVAIGNSNSISLGIRKALYWPKRALLREKSRNKAWDMPPDHTCAFDYSRLRRLVDPYFQVEQCRGFCYFFGSRRWGALLARLPRGFSQAILETLDRFARFLPAFSDIIVVCCAPKKRDAGREDATTPQ